MRRFVVIGGGIIGSSIALELARRKAGKIVVLEKENSVGRHASGRNSGVIHSGINQKPGSIKAKMCLEGSRLLREFCRNRKVPMNECGTLVIARSQQESVVLERLFKMGNECGVQGLRIIDKVELKRREPLANADSALFSPTGATVDSRRLLETVVTEARDIGVEFWLDSEVLDIDGSELHTRHTLD